jgi:hypothetical protein
LWRALITFRTYTKLSWIHLFLMNAFWHVDTNWFSPGAVGQGSWLLSWQGC